MAAGASPWTVLQNGGLCVFVWLCGFLPVELALLWESSDLSRRVRYVDPDTVAALLSGRGKLASPILSQLCRPYLRSATALFQKRLRPCPGMRFGLVPQSMLCSSGRVLASSRQSRGDHPVTTATSSSGLLRLVRASLRPRWSHAGCCPLRPPPGRAVSALTAAMETHRSPLHGIVDPAFRQDSLLGRLGCLLCATWLFIVRDVLARKLTDKQ